VTTATRTLTTDNAGIIRGTDRNTLSHDHNVHANR